MNDKLRGIKSNSDKRRIRTVRIVESCIKQLLEKKVAISVSSIIKQSELIDVVGGGISASALRRNQVAYALYVSHREWRPVPSRNPKRIDWRSELKFIRTVSDKDAKARRLMRYRKPDLVQIVIAISERYSELEQRMLENFVATYETL